MRSLRSVDRAFLTIKASQQAYNQLKALKLHRTYQIIFYECELHFQAGFEDLIFSCVLSELDGKILSQEKIQLSTICAFSPTFRDNASPKELENSIIAYNTDAIRNLIDAKIIKQKINNPFDVHHTSIPPSRLEMQLAMYPPNTEDLYNKFGLPPDLIKSIATTPIKPPRKKKLERLSAPWRTE